MLGGENVLARFVIGVFSQKDPVSHYLLFRLQEKRDSSPGGARIY